MNYFVEKGAVGVRSMQHFQILSNNAHRTSLNIMIYFRFKRDMPGLGCGRKNAEWLAGRIFRM
jgi:hypothetical protein